MLEMYRRDRFREDLLAERCNELLGLDARLHELDEMLAAARRRIPAGRCECGAPLPWGSHFCPNCGRPGGIAAGRRLRRVRAPAARGRALLRELRRDRRRGTGAAEPRRSRRPRPCPSRRRPPVTAPPDACADLRDAGRARARSTASSAARGSSPPGASARSAARGSGASGATPATGSGAVACSCSSSRPARRRPGSSPAVTRGRRADPETIVATSPVVTAPPAPPVADRGRRPRPPRRRPPRQPDAHAEAGLTAWPARNGYTVVLASIPARGTGLAEATAKAKQALSRGVARRRHPRLRQVREPPPRLLRRLRRGLRHRSRRRRPRPHAALGAIRTRTPARSHAESGDPTGHAVHGDVSVSANGNNGPRLCNTHPERSRLALAIAAAGRLTGA